MFVDTARIYKNEKYIGEAIKRSGINRNEIFITSKLSPYEMSGEMAYKALLGSLADLGTDYVDLYLIHWPAKNKLPLYITSMIIYSCLFRQSPQHAEIRKETWQALEKAQREGKCKHIGVSNYKISHIEELLSYSSVKPYANQVQLMWFFSDFSGGATSKITTE